MKKGFIFTLDAILALTIIILVVTGLGIYFTLTPELKYRGSHAQAEDSMEIISNIEMKDTEEWIQNLTEGYLGEFDMNRTVLEIIGTLWLSGHHEEAKNLTKAIFENMTTSCFELLVGDQSIYRTDTINGRDCSEEESVAVASRIASGYKTGENVTGFVTRASLNSIRSKTTSSFDYFGGYVGDGNLTKIIRIPDLADEIKNAYMEMGVGSDFDLYINDDHVGLFQKGSGGGGNMTADKWNIDPSYFDPGDNVVEINFTSEEHNYIGGGYFRTTFNTTEMVTTEISPEMSDKYWFPGINGFVNLYSSFFVPGDLKYMHVYLHFFNNYSSYLKIGDTLVFNSSGNNTDQFVNIPNSTLSQLLSYNDLSVKTIPIRFGTRNITILPGYGDADVILITDVSLSMNWRLNSSNNGVTRSCDDPNLYRYDTKRISLAKCLDKDFVATILNNPGNRVGLVRYNNNGYNAHDLSNDTTSLNSTIEGFSASGATCICCALRVARMMLQEQSNATRNKFIILMSDGVANRRCSPTTPDRTTCCSGALWPLYARWWCPEPWCGYEAYSACGGDSADDTAIQDAINDSCKAHNETNATVHSIGFGPVGDCPEGNQTLIGIANCGNGSYYNSDDATELKKIYEGIADKILVTTFHAQEINITGNATPSRLYTDSYIEFNYTPIVNPLSYGELTLEVEGPKFGGNISSPKEGYFIASNDTKVIDAKVTSYSSKYWTDRVSIKNTSTGTWTMFYKLWDYGDEYIEMGDPFLVQIPINYVNQEDNNSLRVDTGLAQSNPVGGSPDDRAIYTLVLRGIVGYGGVFPRSEGCTKTVQTEGGTILNIPVGNPFDPYDPADDAIDDAVDRLFAKLDTNNNRRIDVELDPNDIEIDTASISGIRWLWGPEVFTLKTW